MASSETRAAAITAEPTETQRPAVIEAASLGYVYPDGTQALDGVSLTVQPGERVGLIGPNGAGKSTLLLCLDGFLPAEGTIRVDGIDLGPRTLSEVRRRIGLVFQNPDDQLFMPTLFDDVAFGPLNLRLTEREVRERATAALAQVGLTGFEQKQSHHLSLGEKRRAAIATVLAMRPPILFLDEPASNLDPRGRRRLIEQLDGMDQTLLVAGHDLDLIGRLCRRVLLLDHGRLAADGPANTILADTALLDGHGL